MDISLLGNVARFVTDASGNVTGLVGPDGVNYAALPVVDPVTEKALSYTADKLGSLTCLYRLQEESGSLLVDSLANGPDLVLEGTLGTARTAIAGYLVPNGSDNYARNTDLNSVLAQILDFRNTDDSAILIGFEIIGNGDVIANSAILAVGGGASGNGQFLLQYSTSEACSILGRGVGETANPTSTAIVVADTTGIETRVSVLLVFHSPVGYVYAVDAYVGGVLAATYSYDFNQGGLATELPSATPNGVTLFASYSTSPGVKFNASSGDAGLRHIFLRRATHDAAEEARIASNLYFFPGERPATLSK